LFFSKQLLNQYICLFFLDIFRADSFSTASNLIIRMITWQNGITQIYVWVIVAVPIVFIATLSALIKHRLRLNGSDTATTIDGFYPILDLSTFWHLVIFFIVIGTIMGLAYTGTNPFIYFQF
jgi:alginate O-acetyltransferase complex protein AlgI